MDVSADTKAKLAKLNGMIRIEAALRTPLPPIKIHAMSGASFAALDRGMRPMTRAQVARTLIAAGAALRQLTGDKMQ